MKYLDSCAKLSDATDLPLLSLPAYCSTSTVSTQQTLQSANMEIFPQVSPALCLMSHLDSSSVFMNKNTIRLGILTITSGPTCKTVFIIRDRESYIESYIANDSYRKMYKIQYVKIIGLTWYLALYARYYHSISW